jgi:hydroxymethylpyrimidine pyrophosphatase-like HAD family hydrolase
MVRVTLASTPKALRLELGLGRHESIAFGDGLNDIGMLEWVGLATGLESFKRAVLYFVWRNSNEI